MMESFFIHLVPKLVQNFIEKSPQFIHHSRVSQTTSLRFWLLALISSLLIRILCLPTFAVDGDLDITFGAGGKVTTAIGHSDDIGHSVVIQSDGKIVVAGSSSDNGGTHDFSVVRYQSDGSLDPSFDTDGKVTTPINGNDSGHAVAIQSNGKIVVAGFSDNGINSNLAVVRYQGDGSLDPPFGTGGKVTTAIDSGSSYGNSVAIQSDGKIVVAGYSANSTNSYFAVVRYQDNGTLDPFFGTGGKVTTSISNNDIGHSVAIQSDGKIIVVGNSGNSTNSNFAMVRYQSNGTLDISFGIGGKVTTSIGGSSSAYSVAIQSDGKIVVAGNSYDSTGINSVFAVVRYQSNGSLDIPFGSGGKVTTAIGSSDTGWYIAIQSDGKIVVAGDSMIYGLNHDFALIRYQNNGGLDSTFGSGGKITTAINNGYDAGHSVAIQSDGKIVVAGYSGNGTDYDFAVARYGLANTAPVATVDTYSTYENTTLNIVAALGVLSNDINGDGNPLTSVLGDPVSHGTLILHSEGSLTYTPMTDWNGIDTFTYYAHDGAVNSAFPATVTIIVNAANDETHPPSLLQTYGPPGYSDTLPNPMGLFIQIDGTGSGSVSTDTGLHCTRQDCQLNVQGEVICKDEACKDIVPTASTILLTPQADQGSVFTSWGGHEDCADGKLFMNGGRRCIAFFHTVHELTVITTGVGKVTESNSLKRSQGIECGEGGIECNAGFSYGTTIYLHATPAPGMTFLGWGGDCQGLQNPLAVKVVKVMTCEARFGIIALPPNEGVGPTIVEPIPVVRPPVTTSSPEIPLPIEIPHLVLDPLVPTLPPDLETTQPLEVDQPNSEIPVSPPIVIPLETILPEDLPPPFSVIVPPSSIIAENFFCPTTGNVSEVCNYGKQKITALQVQGSGIVSNGILIGTLVNHGWVSNFMITATGQLTGGIVTGYIKNEGNMRDFEFRGMSIIGGTLGGKIDNTSEVGGFFMNVSLLANTQMIGGSLKGEIKGDKTAPAFLENVHVKTGSQLSGVRLGKGVKLEQGVIVETE